MSLRKIALLILIVGFTRAHYALKGWDYYMHNHFFWAKIGTFAVIGLLSVPPTLAYIKWRRRDALPSDTEIRKQKIFIHTELLLFVLMFGFAAAMARGFGEIG